MILDRPRVPTTSQEITIPSGRAGVLETLRIMRKIVRQYKRDPFIRNVALNITQMLPDKGFKAQAVAVFRFVRDEIRYTLDVNGVETLHTPDKMLEIRQGDCDDKAILLATLLESIGHPTRFVAVGFKPGELSHVFVETLIGEDWHSMDATEPVDFGWHPDPEIVKDYFIVNN